LERAADSSDLLEEAFQAAGFRSHFHRRVQGRCPTHVRHARRHDPELDVIVRRAVGYRRAAILL